MLGSEARDLVLGLLCLAAMVGFCLLVVGGGRMDDTPRPPHPHCEHAP